MKINFTKKQYLTLMKLVYMGNWMANSHRINDIDNEYESMEDYIFSFAKEFGFEEFVDSDPKYAGKFFPTRPFEEDTDVHELIKEYDDSTFWDDLAERLADRDMFRKYGKETLKKMSRDARVSIFWKLEDEWKERLYEDGLDGLEFNK